MLKLINWKGVGFRCLQSIISLLIMELFDSCNRLVTMPFTVVPLLAEAGIHWRFEEQRSKQILSTEITLFDDLYHRLAI